MQNPILRTLSDAFQAKITKKSSAHTRKLKLLLYNKKC